jgi:hypothetical protein
MKDLDKIRWEISDPSAPPISDATAMQTINFLCQLESLIPLPNYSCTWEIDQHITIRFYIKVLNKPPTWQGWKCDENAIIVHLAPDYSYMRYSHWVGQEVKDEKLVENPTLEEIKNMIIRLNNDRNL